MAGIKNKPQKGRKIMNNVIETEHLTKQYAAAAVVDHISLHVPEGKIYGLLGRNGAGKTTAMKMLLQLVYPTNGTIRLFGSDYRKSILSHYGKIGYIIETPGFYSNLTGGENMRILAKLRGNINVNMVQKALEVVGLDKEKSKVFSNYSLGMKQRLGFAAAIIHEPELLILDEPTNGLDPIGISEMRLLLSELSRKRGTTILISSHVLSEIEQIADIIGVMHEGRLIEEVNMTELQRRNRKYVQFDLSDGKKAAEILKCRFKISDFSFENYSIKIYSLFDQMGEINKIFVENGLLVTKIETCEENLEEYFSDLIGGGGIA